VRHLFSFLLGVITAIESGKKRIRESAKKAKDKRQELKDKMNGVNKSKSHKGTDTNGKKEKVDQTLRVRIMGLITTVVVFFETLPLFLSLMVWFMVILCVVVIIILIMMVLAMLKGITDVPVPDFSDAAKDSEKLPTAGQGCFAFTQEELTASGDVLSPYEKNLYRLGLLANRAISGYDGNEIGKTGRDGVSKDQPLGTPKDLRILMVLGKGSTENGARFYETMEQENSPTKSDIIKFISDKAVNSSGYGFMGVDARKTLSDYYTPALIDKITSAYPAPSNPPYTAAYPPWGIAMSARHFMNNLEEVNEQSWDGIIDTVAQEWGIVASKAEFKEKVLLFSAQIKYHTGDLFNEKHPREIEGYVNFFAALFVATSDNDAERSWSRWSIPIDSKSGFDESAFRVTVLGSEGMNSLYKKNTPDDLNFATSTPIYLNGVAITRPLWTVMWDKFGSKAGMKLAWDVAQSVSHSGARVLNFHYGLSSFIMGTRITGVLADKMKGSSSCDGAVDPRYAQVLKEAEKYIGIPYNQDQNSFSIVTPGKYENGQNINGTFKGFLDCSRFVQTVYASIGVNLPRTSREQWNFKDLELVSVEFSKDKLQPGDIIFFWGTFDPYDKVLKSYKDPTTADLSVKGPNISHLGIYWGDGKMIHAGEKGVTVNDNVFTDYWRKIYVGVKRVKL
jgi:cell wall-associated NlpC family hydrolase